MEEAKLLPPMCSIFLNLHPFEINQDGLSQNLRTSLQDCEMRHRLVLELNEEAILSLPLMRLIHSQIRDLGIRVAYDDFGAGQARLIELSECPPDYLKLDMGLIRNIHLSPNRHNLVRAIIDTCQELNVQTIAEGVETLEEAEMCKAFGCKEAQGYFFARPDAAPSFLDTVKVVTAKTLERRLIS
jgi:EAL domain-containing protein (putative c-di-GMP-specific phosphodiesterase class I)